MIPGVLYAVFGIIGFEAAAPLGEEARNPKRIIPLAVFFSCLVIGVFYLCCYYGATVGYVLGVGFAFGAPLKALVFQGTISTILIVAIYMATGLSCIAYYLRDRRREFNLLLHGLIPLAVFLLFIPVLLAALGIDFGGLGLTR